MDDIGDDPRSNEPASDLTDKKDGGELRSDPRDVFPPIKEGQYKNEDVVLSKETVAFLKKRAGDLLKKKIPDDARGCQLCRIILEDFRLNKKLTGYPLDAQDNGMFPVESKVRHIELERYSSR